MLQPLFMIVFCLVIGYILSEVSRQLGLPRVIGYVVSGLILGTGIIRPFIFSTENLDVLSFLANLGIILLFFYVGLETNIMAFTKHVRQSVLISLFNTLIPLVVGFFLMRTVFGLSTIVSIIIGVSLSVSAQSVSMDILEEMRMLRSKIGGMILSAGAIDDIIELVLVTVLLSLFHINITGSTIQQLLPDIGLFLVFIIIARIWLIPYTLRYFDKAHSSTTRFTWSLLMVLLIASLSEILKVGSVIGAMIAGIVIRQAILKDKRFPRWEEHDVAKSVHIIAFGFLVPLFFIWIGINTDIHQAIEHIWFIILLVLIATIGTVGGTALAVVANKGRLQEGLILGWGLNPKGDLELVIVALALNAALISSAIFTALVAMSVITTIISPIIFKGMVMQHQRLLR
ncbi:cation:proton antiporter [Candidatus Woesearchaeota archaeon]|nr:cation:proton antiporter [Candidatus Woesearchaeota archaeon]